MGMALTEEEFKEALPAAMKKSVNPLMVMRINNTLDNEEEWEHYRDNLIGYASVLTQGKFKMEQYLNAVRYAGFKIMGCTNKQAYKRTFPDKYLGFVADGVAEKDIASYSTAYNKSKLVHLIMEQAMIPTYIFNQDIFQKAINVQASIMIDEKVPARDRVAAANSLMQNLKAPEAKKVELDIGITHNTVIEDYEKVMSKMVEAQRKLIAEGADVKAVANAPIKHDVVEAEVIDG